MFCFLFLLLGRECDLCYFFQFFFFCIISERCARRWRLIRRSTSSHFFCLSLFYFFVFFLHATFGVDLPLPCDIDVTSLGNEWVGLRKGETRAKSIRIIRSIMASDKIEPEMISSFKKEIQVVTMQLVP